MVVRDISIRFESMGAGVYPVQRNKLIGFKSAGRTTRKALELGTRVSGCSRETDMSMSKNNCSDSARYGIRTTEYTVIRPLVPRLNVESLLFKTLLRCFDPLQLAVLSG
jgi:hypothetical protein